VNRVIARPLFLIKRLVYLLPDWDARIGEGMIDCLGVGFTGVRCMFEVIGSTRRCGCGSLLKWKVYHIMSASASAFL